MQNIQPMAFRGSRRTIRIPIAPIPVISTA